MCIILIMPPQWGQTALMMACENGRTDCVKLLIKAGAKLNIGDEVHTIVYTEECIHSSVACCDLCMFFSLVKLLS